MRFTFQESRIWDGSSDAPDESREPVVVKVKPGDNGEARARRKLPAAPLGRRWVLVGQTD